MSQEKYLAYIPTFNKHFRNVPMLRSLSMLSLLPLLSFYLSPHIFLLLYITDHLCLASANGVMEFYSYSTYSTYMCM